MATVNAARCRSTFNRDRRAVEGCAQGRILKRATAFEQAVDAAKAWEANAAKSSVTPKVAPVVPPVSQKQASMEPGTMDMRP